MTEISTSDSATAAAADDPKRGPAPQGSTPRGSTPQGSTPRGIDPRSPRFGASITATLLLVAIILGLVGPSTTDSTTLGQRVSDPAFILVAVIAVLFAWGAFAGIRRHPYGAVFRSLIRPRLAAPAELESPKPPTFAQLIGFVVTAAGLVLAVVGVPWGLVIASAAAFVAAFLNAVFDYCLGCQLYLLLVRTRILA